MPQQPPDYERSFRRPVFCVLGLPFDALTMEEAAASLSDDIQAGRRCFLSTPNVNFLVAARSNPAFRNSVLVSDRSVADGMPIVWIARLLGLPIRERVAGASLIRALGEQSIKRPVRCFFFGGEADAAERACTALGDASNGLVGVGALNPGMGSAARLSSPDTIDSINQAQADFLVVSLGARKGQEWIMRNAGDINTPLISHLGAVVNFHAGTVRRAPVWMQRVGLEWLWRTFQEPRLAGRYLGDGLSLGWLFMTKVIPLMLTQALAGSRKTANGDAGIREPAENAVQLVLEGSLGEHNMDKVRTALIEAASSDRDIEIDFAAVDYIDSAFTGSLLLLAGHYRQQGRPLRLQAVPARVRRILRRQGAEYLLET